MGRYINWDDIVLRYPSINKLGGASEIGSAWIGAVENQLDGMLSKSFTVPFSTNNETIKDLAIELTYIRVGNLKVDESKEMREQFMDRIKRINSGMEGLVTSTGEIVGMIGETVWSSTAGYNSVFDVDGVNNWEVDSSQVNAIENNKL